MEVCVLGWEDSNLQMRDSKSRALPFGYTPVIKEQHQNNKTIPQFEKVLRENP